VVGVEPTTSRPQSERSNQAELHPGPIEGSHRNASADGLHYVWLVGLGTILPFALSIGALRHLPATTVGIVATFERIAASIVAWLWLGETLDTAQLIGGVTVLTGIVLAETSR
jgi:drug/metabolite transporter (DMT)-like permease